MKTGDKKGSSSQYKRKRYHSMPKKRPRIEEETNQKPRNGETWEYL